MSNLACWSDDMRSSENIIALALVTTDEDLMWDCIAILQLRGGKNEFRLASRLTASTSPNERCLGARVLGQLGCRNPTPTYIPESVDILLPMLDDQNPFVVSSAAHALGHRRDSRAIVPLSKLAEHPESDIRFSIACALGGFDDDLAISKLIQLTSDIDNEVRDWATFAIGSLTEIDTLNIRDALFARINDDNDEVRGEALLGLANRNDQRAIDLVQQELQCGHASCWVLDAAEVLQENAIDVDV
jgi:HEAT repeat protein